MKEVSHNEILARYLLDKGKVRADGTVRWNAFMPRNGSTSVYRVSGLTEEENWDIGSHFVAEPSGKPLLGRADLTASTVFANELKVHPDGVPHPRHANIIDWPAEKDKQHDIALDLASNATVKRRLSDLLS